MGIRVASANIAGGARQEKADLCKYKILGNLLSGVDIAGLQEVIQVYEPGSHQVIRDDIKELQDNSGLSDYQCCFFPYLDSTQQSHPGKWSSEIFRPYYEQGYQILEGTAILVKQRHCVYDFWRNDLGYAVGQIIPWYLGTPTFYLGNRDTQPRSLLLARIRLANRVVLFCCVHLTTLKGERDKQGGQARKATIQKAIDIRTAQISWILHYIKSYQEAYREESGVVEPIVLVGDFNAEPNAVELNGLKKSNLELIPFATPNVGYTHRKHKILIDLIYATAEAIKGSACIVNLEKLEAFSDRGVSDHNPVIADLEFIT